MEDFDKKRTDLVRTLFQTGTADSAEFEPHALVAMPVPTISAIISRLLQKYGQFQKLSSETDATIVRLAQAEIPVQLFLDPQGKISGLRIHPETLTTGSIEEHAGAICAQAGESSVLIQSAGSTLYNHQSTRPLSVASAFKLCVLAAVMRAVAAEQFQWEQVFTVPERWRSLPTGILQTWPSDIPLTLMSLCCLMISLSDNTAADALIQIVGREAVESLSPFNCPFLTTREAFGLITKQEVWRQGDAAARRALLTKIAEAPLSSIYAGTTLAASAVGWFFSAEELRAFLCQVRNHPAMTINSGPIRKARWQRVIFKGGQQAGALNISLMMIDANGEDHIIVVTNNAPEEVDPERVLIHVRAIGRLLEDRVRGGGTGSTR